MTRAAKIAYGLFALQIVLIAWLHLGTFLLTTLFAYLALQIFFRCRSKALSVTLYLGAVIIVGVGLFSFAALAYRTLPGIADTAIPAMAEFAEKHGLDLPVTDYGSLKTSALAEAREGLATIGRYARIASLQTVLLIAGLVVALGLFLNPSWTAGNHDPARGSGGLYSEITRELSIRFAKLYRSFATVMVAQIRISAINTVLTAVFLICCRYPYAPLLLCLVFLCGLIPVVGNLCSNTVIVGVGFTLSPWTGLVALVFLILIHKLEYFLNSKIIGRRIDSPMWLTLIGLLAGERLMGISGMILAPVLLDYIRQELSESRALPQPVATPAAGTRTQSIELPDRKSR
ncbi:AI-2E family transporter [Acidobacteria bacterium AB60]|nr:AI-2E family transporter [Acidobacteria bacterium AB60]